MRWKSAFFANSFEGSYSFFHFLYKVIESYQNRLSGYMLNNNPWPRNHSSSTKPCKIPEIWEIKIYIDFPILLLSIWELPSNTLFAYTIDYNVFLPVFSSFFWKKLEEIPFFPFFPEETYFFRKFLNPGKNVY